MKVQATVGNYFTVEKSETNNLLIKSEYDDSNKILINDLNKEKLEELIELLTEIKDKNKYGFQLK